MRARDEIVVVGGGVIGLAVAWELARRDRRVRVLERAQPAGSATAAAGGMLAPVSEAQIETTDQLRFGEDSLARFPAFVAELERATGLGCGFRREGTLWVATDRDDREELGHLAETLRLRDLPHRRLDAAEIHELEPHLSSRVTAGLLVRSDLAVDPRRLGAALAEAFRRRGGRLDCGVRVREVVARDGRVVELAGDDREGRPWSLKTRVVVVSAGVWCGCAGEGGVRLPLPPLGLRPIKGQLLRLRGEPLLGHVVRHPEGYLVPREDGELLVGATMEESGFDERPTAGATLDLLRHARQVLPGLYDLELAGISVGLRSAVDDQLPLIGETDVEGLYLATGHFRNGILLAPATARYLADRLVDGKTPDAIRPFSPRRLTAGRSPAPVTTRSESEA